MAQVARVKDWTTNEVLTEPDLETEFNTIFNAHNNHDIGASIWQRVLVTNATDVPLVINNSTGTQNIANFQDNGINIVQIVDGGYIRCQDGTVATPQYSFSSDPNTGIYRSSVDEMRFVTGGADRITINSSGQIGIGTTSPGGLLDIRSATAGTTVSCIVDHDDNTNGLSHARLIASTGGASGGDPFTEYQLTGIASWVIGIDNSDSDKFKISESNTLGTSDRLSIESGGVLDYRLASVALGGGSTATLGTIGGSGPITVGQNAWMRIKIAGTDSYIPFWR